MSQHVGIVVIGRNEGERLIACLRSVIGSGPVVYVDSGSTDGSVTRAKELGAEVVELDLDKPFTAARARNAGFARLRDLEPGLAFVQFVDGDCEVREGWIAEAAAALLAESATTVVCGRLRERHPERSIYNRMCDIGWDYPLGEILSCGGIAMYRADRFAAADGFDETLIAGEEFELCSRLRRTGGCVKRIAAEMAWHDVGITRFGQWWNRAVRTGFGSAEGMVIYDNGTGVVHRRRLLRAVFWGGCVPFLLLTALTASVWWSLGGIAASAIALLWCFNFARMWVRELRGRQDWRLGFYLAVFSAVGKFAELRGALEYILRRVRHSPTRVIEYREA